MSEILTIDGDADEIAELLELAAGELERAKVPENEVVVGAARLELVVLTDEGLSERTGVADHLLSIRLPLGLASLMERSRNTGNGLPQPDHQLRE